MPDAPRADTVLVVVAHPDDETLGAGGTLAAHAARGETVVAMAFTDGTGARGAAGAADVERRERAARTAAEELGFRWLACAGFPDNRLDTVALLDLIAPIEDAKRALAPTIVYTHSAADLNVDHRIVAQAVLTAFRPQPGEVWRELRAFEVPSATDYGHPAVTGTFTPNLLISIEATWPRKLRALEAYGAEMRGAPHARSLAGVKALARLRGAQAGLAMAEAFQILRRIER